MDRVEILLKDMEADANEQLDLYRILAAERPVRRDFESNFELGRRPQRPLSPEGERRWAGLSVFRTLELARSHHDRSPWIGTHRAQLTLHDRFEIEAMRTTPTPTPGHWALWADPDALLNCIVAIIAL